MFKLIVLSCLLAAAVAAPGVLVPSAVSHQSIVQTHHPVVKHVVSPVVVRHVAPVVQVAPVVHAPVVHAAPIVVPSAVSHQSIVQNHKSVLIRSHEPYVRLHHTPIVRVHHAPAVHVVRHAPVYHSGLVQTGLTYAAHAPVVRVL